MNFEICKKLDQSEEPRQLIEVGRDISTLDHTVSFSVGSNDFINAILFEDLTAQHHKKMSQV